MFLGNALETGGLINSTSKTNLKFCSRCLIEKKNPEDGERQLAVWNQDYHWGISAAGFKNHTELSNFAGSFFLCGVCGAASRSFKQEGGGEEVHLTLVF
jgi:hypothetical protein